jgi:hypothetical protein
MSAADQRIAELLERWLASVELHARYLQLDDAAYARVQDWPRHQRPTGWLLDLAHARLLELQRQFADREARGDTGFSEALELMSFLTTLLGSEHVERFIPLARPTPATSAPAQAAVKEPAPAPPPVKAAPRSARKAPPGAGTTETVSDKLAATVIADAVRFLNWGREWPQLASLIARLADRPPEQEILRILRKHRAAIEAQAGRPPD